MIFVQLLPRFAAACGGGNFLGFPTWYKYLPSVNVTVNGNAICTPQFNNLVDVWLIVAAVIEILLRVAAIIAVIFVVYGGFTYMTSQGDASKVAQGKDTLVAALAGLCIAVIAATLVGFIAGRLN
jgi:hypothetical protein